MKADPEHKPERVSLAEGSQQPYEYLSCGETSGHPERVAMLLTEMSNSFISNLHALMRSSERYNC